MRPSSRRVSTSTRVGSPMRPGTTAEAITPIIVARTTGAQAIGVSGSAARSVWCQETERSSSDSAISTSASTIQPGVAVIRAWPMRCSSRRESANATSAGEQRSPTSTDAERVGARGRASGAGVLRCAHRAGSIRSRRSAKALMAPSARCRPRAPRPCRYAARSDEARSITAARGPLMASTSPSLERQ